MLSYESTQKLMCLYSYFRLCFYFSYESIQIYICIIYMKSNCIKCYCAQTYDLEGKTSKYYNTFGNDTDRERQGKQIKHLQQKRNEYYRNNIDMEDIDNKIKEFHEEVEDMQKVRPLETLELQKSKDCPDLDVPKFGTHGIFGSSQRGKTNLMIKYYEKYYKDTDNICILISPSMNIELFDNMDCIRINRFDKQSDQLLKDIFFIQSKCKAIKSTKDKGKGIYSFVFFIDDCITNVRWMDSINMLIMTARNLNISTCIALQYCKTLSKAARSNLNICSFFGQNFDEDIYTGTLQCFLSSEIKKQTGISKKEDQIEEYRRLTDDTPHSFLIYTSKSRELKRCILDL